MSLEKNGQSHDPHDDAAQKTTDKKGTTEWLLPQSIAYKVQETESAIHDVAGQQGLEVGFIQTDPATARIGEAQVGSVTGRWTCSPPNCE